MKEIINNGLVDISGDTILKLLKIIPRDGGIVYKQTNSEALKLRHLAITDKYTCISDMHIVQLK